MKELNCHIFFSNQKQDQQHQGVAEIDQSVSRSPVIKLTFVTDYILVSHDFWHMLQTKMDRDMNSTQFSSFLFPHQVVYLQTKKIDHQSFIFHIIMTSTQYSIFIVREIHSEKKIP